MLSQKGLMAKNGHRPSVSTCGDTTLAPPSTWGLPATGCVHKVLQEVARRERRADGISEVTDASQITEQLCDLTISKSQVSVLAKGLDEEILAVYDLPEGHRKRIRSTNMLERYNQELKRRTRVVRIFPNGRRVCG